jgi:uncharacterized protein (TIGR02246 family)
LVFAVVAAVILAAIAVLLGPTGRRARRRPEEFEVLMVDAPLEDPPPPIEATDPREEIGAAGRGLVDALQRGDPHAYAAAFTEDALSLPAHGATLRGRDGLLAAMTETFYKIRFLEADVSPLDLRLHGDTALESGRYRYVVISNRTGVRQTLEGRYLTAWTRVNGAWKVALEAAQPEAPPE